MEIDKATSLKQTNISLSIESLLSIRIQGTIQIVTISD